ncbi:TPA: hypothetical protein ACYLN4_005402, partial [Burkholderia lata]
RRRRRGAIDATNEALKRGDDGVDEGRFRMAADAARRLRACPRTFAVPRSVARTSGPMPWTGNSTTRDC